MERIKNWLGSQNLNERSSILFLIKGYLVMTLICFILLLLPFARTGSIPIVDHAFFTFSIVSTTGLVPLNFGSSYSFFGQLVSLIFIQLGGIGYMSLTSFVLLKQPHGLPKISARLLKTEYHLPSRYPLLSFIYSVFIFTILIEFIGAVILYIGFKDAGVENPIWDAIFTSVSAFCTAGFSLFDDSLTSLKDYSLVTNTVLVLSLLGSIGFIVLLDFWLRICKKRKSITLTSKIILSSTFLICILGTLIVFFSDSQLMTLGWEGFNLALFQVLSAHSTVGFNNYDIGQIGMAGIFIMILVMVIGASPSGTGGGIKTTSITAIFAVLISVLKRNKHITFFKKEIPASNIYLAISSLIFYSFISILGTWVILVSDGTRFTFEQILFEVVSALSTVGLSTGITGDLSDFSKLVICFLMFIGRLGALSFGFALISQSPLLRNKPKIEDIAI